MILFHGTNTDFSEILLDKCLPYKDFGKGFYLTERKEQAEQMAWRKSRRVGKPIVLEYEIDEVLLKDSSELKILRFTQPNESWAEFILNNRERRETPFRHEYDIVIGPVADDGIAYILSRYLEGSFTLEEALKELRFKHLSSQICFCTEKALKYLKRI